MDELEVHIPTAEIRQQSHRLAPRLRSLSNAKIGWLDNMKANARELLAEVADSAQSSCAEQQFEVVTQSKNATAPAPQSVLAYLQTCDAVVLAIAD